MTILFYVLIAATIIFLMCVAAIPELNAAFIGWARGASGGAFDYFAGVWTGIASTPIYQTYHVFIWVAGTLLLAFVIHQAHAANKLPIFKVKEKAEQQAVMKEPQTIIVREQPIPIQPAKQTEKVTEEVAG